MSNSLEQLRERLKTRYNALISSDFRVFHAKLNQYWKFLNAYPIFVEAIEELEYRFPQVRLEVNAAYTSGRLTNLDAEKPFYDDEIAQVAMSLFVIELCVENKDAMIEANIGHAYSREGKYNTALLLGFSKLFMEPFSVYLDELLSEQRFTLTFLLRYKQRCEWFERDSLCKAWAAAKQNRGEWKLRQNLLEYLHDQGFTLREEPASASGEVDLIAMDANNEQLFIETKVFNAEKNLGKDYIARGFAQTYSYLEDHNAPAGYLVLYKTGDTPLLLKFTETKSLVPFVVQNNKTIFAVLIDVSDLPSASKRKLMPAIEITEKDIAKKIEELDLESDEK